MSKQNVTWSQAELDEWLQRVNQQGKKISEHNRHKVIPADDRVTPKKGLKYHNKKVEVNGEVIDSKKEAGVYMNLLMKQRSGLITDLRRQVRYDYVITFAANGKEWSKSGFYRADFTYIENGQLIVADAKGMKTSEYKRKKKIMKKLYDIEILEL